MLEEGNKQNKESSEMSCAFWEWSTKLSNDCPPPAAVTPSSTHETWPRCGRAEFWELRCEPQRITPPSWFERRWRRHPGSGGAHSNLWFQNPWAVCLWHIPTIQFFLSLALSSNILICYKYRYCHITLIPVWVQNTSLGTFNKTKREQKRKKNPKQVIQKMDYLPSFQPMND